MTGASAATDATDATAATAAIVRRWRRETPGCAVRVHLNNAGSSLPPRRMLAAVLAYLRREAEIGGYEAEAEAAGEIAAAYEQVALLLGARPANVAIVENATVAFAQALSAFDFRPGDRIVTSRNDYLSNQLMYLALARRAGVEVVHAAELPAGGVDPQSVRELAAHPCCRLVAISWVPTHSGLVQAVEEVGEICEALGVPYLVDACQALGQIPVDVGRLRCDFLAATARKFLRGPRGIGFLYVADRALDRGIYPLGLDMRGASLSGAGGFELAPGARRFENWEFAYALVLGMGEAARYAREVGVERGGGRAIELAAYARERLAAVPGVRVADRGRRLCAIVTFAVAGWEAQEVVGRLRREGINTNAPASANDPVVRLSPHYYNTRDEVDAAVAAVAAILELPRR